MVKIVLKRCALGAGIGIIISQAIAIIISLCIADSNFYAVVPQLAEKMNSEISAVIVQTVCSLFYGAIFGGISIIWEIDNWSILRQTAVHFSIASVVIMPIAYIAEWMHHSVLGAIIYFSVFAFIYALIWLSQYIMIKKHLSDINKKIKKK